MYYLQDLVNKMEFRAYFNIHQITEQLYKNFVFSVYIWIRVVIVQSV